MLYVGLVSGVIVGNMVSHAARVDAVRVYIATLILIVPALAGARLLYVAANWRIYRNDLGQIWDRSKGGYVMYGGYPLMLLFSVPLLRILRVGFGAFWDVAIFTILVGMLFTRIGCLLNGCCAGVPTTSWLGFYLPNTRGSWEKRVPTQAFEAGWAALLLIFAVVMRRFVPFPGALFWLVSALYGCGRMIMEFAREGEREAGFRLAHAISLVICLISVSTLTFYWRR